MAQKSTKLKQCGKKLFEPADFQRLFKYLPLDVLRKYTNIEKLVIAEYEQKHNKPPPGIYVNKTIKKYHTIMMSKYDWKEPIDKLDFNWPNKDKTHASIWSIPKEDQDDIHGRATKHQLKFIYLPLFVYEEATNIEKLMYNEAVKCQQDLTMVKSYVKGLFQHIHKVGSWHSFLSELKFNIDESSDTEPVEKRPMESTRRNEQSEPVPGTSKQADIAKRLRSSDPVPNTSKETIIPISTLKSPEIVRTTRKTQIDSENRDNLKRTARDADKCQPNHTTKSNEEVSTQGNKRPSKRKKYQYSNSIVNLTDALNSVQIVGDDSSPPKIPKRSQHLSAIAKKQTNQIPTENINLASKLDEDTTSTNTENDEGNERCQTERVISISDELSDAQNDESTSKSVDENVPPAEKSSESLRHGQRREFDADEWERGRHMGEPSDFQREVQAMTYDEFVTKTNIKEIIRKAQGVNCISQEEMNIRLEFYYGFRMQTNNWHRNDIRNLKYIECECKRKANQRSLNEQPQTNNDDANRSRASEVSSKSAPSHHVIEYEPNEFQKEVIAMDFDTFVRETNVSDLVQQEFHKQFNGAREFTPKDLDYGLQRYYRFKKYLQKKYVHSLRNLRYKPCDCTRKKTFADKSIQTDQPMAQNATQALQSKLALLAVHRVTDDEIIHIQSIECSEVSSSSQDSPIDINESAEDEGTQSTPSANVNAPPQSQQILSFEQVRMTEFVFTSCMEETEQPNVTDPIETEAVSNIKCETPEPDNEVEVTDEQETIYTSPSVGTSQFRISPISPIQNSSVTNATTIQFMRVLSTAEQESGNNTEVKDGPQLEYHLGDDSDVEYIHLSEKVIDVLDTQDEFLCVMEGNSTSESLYDVNSLIMVQTEPEDLQNVSEEASEEARQQLIRTLEGSPLIQHSDDSNNRASSRAFTEDQDPLSNIPGPGNENPPLEFIVRTRSEAAQHHGKTNRSAHTAESQPSQDSSSGHMIDESSSIDRINNSGMINDSCVERANLLNQDNTLFLDINTQLINSDGSTTSQINQSTVIDVSPVQLEEIPDPKSSRLRTFNDQNEFLHHINIENVLSSFKNVILPNGERDNQLSIETILKHQCNGGNRIIVDGNAIKLIMRMNDKEWDALGAILTVLGEYKFDASSQMPINDTILHRTLHYLFKTAPKISTVHIAYGDQDFETARVFKKSTDTNKNVTVAIDPYVLTMMKSKAQESNKK